jgi:N-acetylmuramoyl-L-alanine amidase
MHGTREKDVTLAIARALQRSVDAEPGMRAVLTRDGDYFVPLRDRMRRARAQQADLFVSIHADSIRDRAVDGSSVYILSQRGATNEAARWLAERENAADLIGGVSLEDKGDLLASVLLDLSQTASLSASETAAEHVLHQLNLVGEVRKPLVQQAGFMVLKSPDIPSMLIETAYISNPAEEQRLRGVAHQAKLAAAIHQGLREYFYADPPAGSRIAQIAAGAPRPELATPEHDTGG